MGSFIGSIITWLLGLIFGRKDPAIQDIAASDATAQAELTQQEAANAIITKAGAARADAADRVVRILAGQKPGATDASANAALAAKFPDDFAD